MSLEALVRKLALQKATEISVQLRDASVLARAQRAWRDEPTEREEEPKEALTEQKKESNNA
jgi:hypothetical protein